jgi:hypothetical protein
MRSRFWALEVCSFGVYWMARANQFDDEHEFQHVSVHHTRDKRD